MELRSIVTTAVLAFLCGLIARILGGGIAGFYFRQSWEQQRGATGARPPLLHVTASSHRETPDADHVPLRIGELQGDLRGPSEADSVPLIIQELHIERTPVDDGTAVEEVSAAEREELGRKIPHDSEDTERILHGIPTGHEPGVNRGIEQSIASMTLGSVAFQMTLFYLVNHKDPDMRRYSYGVIGETISIFCAVLTFNTGYSWVAEYTDQLSNKMQTAALAVLCAFFFVFMESVVMISARVRGEKAHKRSTIRGKELSVMKHVLNARTFGAGAAQMCGAACVRAFGHLQLRAYQDYGSPWLAIGVVPFALAVFLAIMWVSTKIRNAIIFMDGIVGETELTWAEVAEECENEVCGLCMGFLTATVARMLLTGSLPYILMNALKKSNQLQDVTLWNVFELFAFGFLSAGIVFCVTLQTFGHIDASIDQETVQSKFSNRILVLVIKTLGFNFSWCICFVMHFLGIRFALFQEGIRLRLVLALVQSSLSFAFIQLLDIISNMKYGGVSFDKAITTLNDSLAVSIGLSWEHAFHACVDLAVDFMVEDKVVFTHSNDPKFWSACLSGLICIVVLPAYRWYIVPTRYQLWEEFEEGMKIKEEHYRQSLYVTGGAPSGERSPMSYVDQSHYSPVYELSEYTEQLQALLQRQQQACQSRSVMKTPMSELS